MIMITAEKFTPGQPHINRMSIGCAAMLNTCQSFLVIQQQQPFEEKLLESPARCERLLPHGEAEAVGRSAQDRAGIKRLDLAAEPVSLNPITQTFQILPARGKGIAALVNELQYRAVIA